jgi:hypothetical protein
VTTSKEPGTEDASRGVYEQVVLDDMQGVAMWQLHPAGADTDSANTAHTTLNYFTRSITRSPAQGTLQGAASEQVVLEDVQGVALWQLHLAAANTGSTRLRRHNTIAFTPPLITCSTWSIFGVHFWCCDQPNRRPDQSTTHCLVSRKKQVWQHDREQVCQAMNTQMLPSPIEEYSGLTGQQLTHWWADGRVLRHTNIPTIQPAGAPVSCNRPD